MRPSNDGKHASWSSGIDFKFIGAGSGDRYPDGDAKVTDNALPDNDE